jgi:hypothetical protein
MNNFEDIILENSSLDIIEINNLVRELDVEVSAFLSRYMLLVLSCNIDLKNKLMVIQNTNLLALSLLHYLKQKPLNLEPSLN